MPITNEQLKEIIEKRMDCERTEREDFTKAIVELTLAIKPLEEVIRILKGSNGDAGLVARVTALEKSTTVHRDETKSIAVDFRRILFGDDKNVGLIHQIEDLIKWKSTLDRWGWFLATTAIISLLNIVITLVFEFARR